MLNFASKIITIMDIYFQDKDFEALVNNERKCKKKLGERRTKILQRRLADIALADNLEETMQLPGHFHPLRENRNGPWACDLDQPYRLIIEPHEKPIPADEGGNYKWVEVKMVDVNEIVNYHEKKK